jgi:hypothetical protein
MEIILWVGIPLILVFGGALLGFTVDFEDRQQEEVRKVGFQPRVIQGGLTAEQVKLRMEARLRMEAAATSKFADEPSRSTLWAGRRLG